MHENGELGNFGYTNNTYLEIGGGRVDFLFFDSLDLTKGGVSRAVTEKPLYAGDNKPDSETDPAPEIFQEAA